jgi:hypothetical protein
MVVLEDCTLVLFEMFRECWGQAAIHRVERETCGQECVGDDTGAGLRPLRKYYVFCVRLP